MSECKCLPPIIDDKSRILILGTIPGNESFEKKEYYANQDNIFWDIIYRVFNPPLKADEELNLTYDEKVSILQKHNIALWDVLAGCRREGNRDSEMTDEEINDFDHFIKTNYNIKYIIFNSKKAYLFFKKKYSHILKECNYYIMYSTSSSSPVNAFHILYKWSKIKTLIEL